MDLKINYEKLYYMNSYNELSNSVHIEDLKLLSTDFTYDKILPFYYLSLSYERQGLLTRAWEIASLLEKKISKFTKSNDTLSLLVFVNLKIYLLIKKGMNKEALNYQPIFGESLEDNQENGLFPDNQIRTKFIAFYYFNIGQIYQNIGEFEEAFRFYQKSLGLINNDEKLFPFSCEIFTKMGEIFMLKGEYFYANQNLTIALQLAEDYINTQSKFETLLAITILNLYLENYTETENLFESLFTIQKSINLKDSNLLSKLFFWKFVSHIWNIEKEKSLETSYMIFIKNMSTIKNQHTPLVNLLLILSKGLYYHKLKGINSLEKSKEFLESILPLYDSIDCCYTNIGKLELCQIYFKEIKYLKREQAITKFNKRLKDLFSIAKKNFLYPLLIELFLLQSNLELHINSSRNISNAEKYLILAELISEEKNIKHVTGKILLSETKFKNQLSRWQNLISETKELSPSDLQGNTRFDDLKKILLMSQTK